MALIEMSRDDLILAGDVLNILNRRKWLIGGVVFLGLALGTLVLHQLTPQFRAEASVAIETRRTQAVNIEDVVSGLSADAATIQTETAVLRSRNFAETVVEKLDLVTDPEFNPPEQGSETLIVRLVPDFLRAAVRSPAATALAEADIAEGARAYEDIIHRFRSNLDIAVMPRSHVLHIRFTSPDPVKAARIANAVAELYIVDQLEAKFETTRMTAEWLNSRLTELRARVEASDRAVELYRAEANLTLGQQGQVSQQQLSELNSQIILVRADRAEKEARLRQVRTVIARGGSFEASSAVLGSPLIQRLREQEAQVVRKQSELLSTYAERHPTVINAQAELRDLRAKITEEVAKIAQALASDVDVVRAREATLVTQLNALQAQVGDQAQAQVRLRELERDAASNQALFETFLTRFKEAEQQTEAQRPDARIISSAVVPGAPSFPRFSISLAVVALGSVFAGLGLALLMERLDDGVRSGEQVEALGGGAVLAMIPAVRADKGAEPEEQVLQNPLSSLAESFRALQAGVSFSNVDNPPRVVMFTSSVPGEGKTFTALGFARINALSGLRCILVEADMRRPRLSRVLGIDGRAGLSQVLAPEMAPEIAQIGAAGELPDLSAVVWREERSGLDVLLAGTGSPNPNDLLRSRHMADLLARLRQTYDVVVIDCPPVLAVTDARTVSRLVDTAIYVVAWERTPRPVVQTGLQMLTGTGVALAGTVISKVDVLRHARYGYGDYAYYYGRYREYYVG